MALVFVDNTIKEDMLYEKTGNHHQTGKAGELKSDSGRLQGQRHHDQQCHGLQQSEGVYTDVPGTKYNVNLLPKVKVETVIPKELADPIIDAVVDEINTGNYGDGKIFVYDVQDAIRIRTGEHGREAL